MNHGREKGDAQDKIVNGVYNPAVLQNSDDGTIRYFLSGFQPDAKLTLLNRPVTSIKKSTILSGEALNWTPQSSNMGSNSFVTVAHNDGVWVAGGGSGALRTSTDNGVTWNTQTSNFGGSTISAVAYGNGTWVAVASG